MTDEAKALVELMRDRVVYDSRHYIPDPLLSAGADLIETQAREIERLREALVVLRDLPIVENDNPDTLHIEGVAYTGPTVDFLFRAIRKIKEVARTALAGDSHDQ